MTRLLGSPLPLALLTFAALAGLTSGHADKTDNANRIRELVPVDTSELMGSPEPVLPYDFEPAFPAVRFNRPLAFTHPGDGSGRAFVTEQDGIIRVFPNRRDVRPDQCKTFLDLREV